ncbi:hypothetical protein KKG45_13520 [bacterium]|nr:hypothetical protein [bacterium]MBU1074260.1 hypothetical protein [bacterium]MBU1677011.1 hypothetical protein [bacterium]
MNLCKHCGVEVEEDARYCPLCRNPFRPGMDGEKKEPAPPSRDPQKANRRIRRWLLEVLSLLAVTGALVVFAADFISGMSLSWAHYPLASIAFLWLSAVLLILCSSRAWIYLPAEIVAAGLFIFMLDRFTPGPAWFLPLALPVLLLIGTVLALTLTIVRKLDLSPFATIATAMLAAGAFAVGLELLLNRYFDHRWFVSWSALACVCMLPLVLLLLYLRKWLKERQAEIRKMLHM